MRNESPSNGPIDPDHQLLLAEARRKLQLYEESMEPAAFDDDEDAIDLRKYWNVIVHRKWTIIITLIVVVIGALIKTYTTTPTYRAKLLLQIERPSGSRNVLGFEGAKSESPYSYDFYATQYELLKSRSLAKRVVDQLGLDMATVEKKADKSTSFIADLKRGIREFIGADEKADTEEKMPAGDGPRRKSGMEGVVLGGLTVQPIKNSRLVWLYYTSTDPELAAKILNALAKSFVDVSLERRYESSSYAKKFLEDRIQQVKANLEESERKLVEYAQKRNIIDLKDKHSILMEKLKSMNSQLAAVQAERLRTESIYQEMLQTQGGGFQPILENESISAMKARKAELEELYNQKLKVFKPAYPEMLQIKTQIEDIDKAIAKQMTEIRDSVKNTYQTKVREELKLKEAINKIKNDIMAVQKGSTEFMTLRREVDTNKELYDGLLQRMKEVGVAAGMTDSNISIVDAAEVPRTRFKPSLRKNLMMAIVLGLFGGVMLAFLFDHLDDSVKDPDELEKETRLPILGIIPDVRRERIPEEDIALLAYDQPKSAFAEAYRSMRTALMFSSTDGAPKVLHFTSMGAGEGKTTSAISTAINFIQSGSTVLLIDSDLRNPSIHKEFDLPNDIGLTNYLTGTLKPVEVAQSSGIARLFIMTSGDIPPNPAELLQSGKMVDLLALAAERFDYVILDGPPVLGLADALVLANLARATILVVAAGDTRMSAIEAGLKRLKHAKANVVGITMTKFTKIKGGYGYDYHYSYSYGLEHDEAAPETSTRQSA